MPSFAAIGLLAIGAANPSLGTQDTSAASTFPETVIAGQFVIILPESWAVYDQTQAVTGNPAPRGLIIFSARPLLKPGEAVADRETLQQVESGELPSFFVDRHEGSKGISCHHFSKSDAYWLGTQLKKDPIYGLGGQLFGFSVPKHDRITLGGCEGWRYQGSPKDWILDIRAVSDGHVLYLFSLRNKKAFYATNLAAYDAALGTIQFLTIPDSVGPPPN